MRKIKINGVTQVLKWNASDWYLNHLRLNEGAIIRSENNHNTNQTIHNYTEWYKATHGKEPPQELVNPLKTVSDFHSYNRSMTEAVI